MRIKLTLEYDGTRYAGWQRQINGISVQQCVEEGIARLAGEARTIIGASRTDAGVHARGQVAHFDTAGGLPPEKWALALNTRLPSDIRAVLSEQAEPNFHARFHAVRKRYVYRFHCAPHAAAIGRQYAWHLSHPLDVDAMAGVCGQITGTHDFACCMASGGKSKTTLRTVYATSVLREGNEIVFAIEGDGFLYNMVRILAGTLAYIGLGKLGGDEIDRALQEGNRRLLGPTAPPHGLCLEWVRYNG